MAVVAITGVTLLHGRGGAPRPGVTGVVRRASIDGVLEPGRRPPRGARRVDGEGGYLLPGLIDLHAHLLLPRCELPAGSDDVFDRRVCERMLAALLEVGAPVRSPPQN